MKHTQNKSQCFIKASELAKALSVSRALVSKWNKKGLPCFFIGDVKEHKRGARPRSDLAEAVQTLEWSVAPYVADGEEAEAKAQEVAKVVTDALWKRNSRKPGTFAHSFGKLINALVHGLFRGFNVHEIEWANDGELVYPAAYHQLPPQFMRWEYRAGHVDRLLFVPDGETDEPRAFPEHKFIVGLNSNGPDHPLFNATYYSLIAWYGAYKFGLGWFMEYCQKYGMPKLVFHYESDRDRQQLEADLAEERVLNNILLKGDRTVDIANAPAGGASLPQRELLNLAESQCHKLILGQTLTSDTSRNGGSLAQARVHAGVQADIVKKRAEYVADVLNSQLIPSIVLLNYGSLDVPMPELRFKIPQEGVTLERVQVAKTALEIKGMKLKKSEVYEFIGFAQPAEGDEVFESAADDPKDGFSALFGKGKSGNDTDPDNDPLQPKKKAPAKPEDAAEPVSAAKSPAPTDPAQEWLSPIKEKFLEARRNGASMADLKKMLLTMHPNTKALAKAFANNILAGFAGEGEEVDASNAGEREGSRRRAEPIEMPDGTKCYMVGCERHEENGSITETSEKEKQEIVETKESIINRIKNTKIGEVLNKMFSKYLNRAPGEEPSNDKHVIGEVSQKTIDKVKELSNTDLTGYKFVIQASAYHHSYRKHRHLNEEDIFLIPDVAENWDTLQYQARKNDADRLAYRKTIDGVTYRLVAKIGLRNKELLLYFTSLFGENLPNE